MQPSRDGASREDEDATQDALATPRDRSRAPRLRLGTPRHHLGTVPHSLGRPGPPSRDAHGTISGRLRTPSWDTVLPSGGAEAPSWDGTTRSRDGTPPSREARDTILGRPRHHLGTVCHDLETPVHTILARSVAISRRRGTISGHHATVSGRDATIWGEADANLRTTQRPLETPATKTQNLSEPPCVIVSGRAHEHLPGWFFTLSGDTLPRALSRWKKPYGTSSRDAQTPLPRGGLPRYRIPSRDGTNVCVTSDR